MSDMNNYEKNNEGANGSYSQPQQPQQFNYSSGFGYTGAPVQQPQQKGKSIAALVLGVCSLIAWFIPLFGYPVSIVGIVMGAQGVKRGGKGMAIAGIILSAIGLILTLINSVLGAMLAVSAL